MSVRSVCESRFRMNRAWRRSSATGWTLFEALAALSILVALVLLTASTLGVFTTYTPSSEVAATLLRSLAEARAFARARQVRVIPVLLVDEAQRVTVVYAAEALELEGAAPDWTVKLRINPELFPTYSSERPEDSVKRNALLAFVPDRSAPGLELLWLEKPGTWDAATKLPVLARGVHRTAQIDLTGDRTRLGYVLVSRHETPLPPVEAAAALRLNGHDLGAYGRVECEPPARLDEPVAPLRFVRQAYALGGAPEAPQPFLPVFEPDGSVDLAGPLQAQHARGLDGRPDYVAVKLLEERTGLPHYVVVFADGRMTRCAQLPPPDLKPELPGDPSGGAGEF